MRKSASLHQGVTVRCRVDLGGENRGDLVQQRVFVLRGVARGASRARTKRGDRSGRIGAYGGNTLWRTRALKSVEAGRAGGDEFDERGGGGGGGP